MNFVYYVLIFCGALTIQAMPKGNRSTRIIGGKVARATEFPYNAAIYYEKEGGNYFCSGALINNQWVITSGTCVYNATRFTIQLGSIHLTRADPNRVRLSTEHYVVHPEFNPETLENDIGLIRFHMPITFSSNIRNVNVAHMNLFPTMEVVALGWGQTSDDTLMEEELHDVRLTIMTNEECKLFYGDQVTDSMVCVAGNYNEGACHGDNGSPLIEYGSRGMTFLVGIQSFLSGNGCETPEPTGYTRTYLYRDWIRNVTSS